MRRRLLAAAAVAGWSKGIVGAAVLPAVMEQPAGAAVVTTAEPPTVVLPSPACTPGPILFVPSLVQSPGQPAQVSVFVKGQSTCPGTLSLFVSSDGQTWGKTGIASQHVDPSHYQPVTGPCSPGTNWYKGRFVSDDGSVTIRTDTVAPTKFTC